ncbi:MAG TPA: heparinase, partial [Thermopetrobacter sp.]|nr:heparinase [Thermopetrobacter sp.]
RVINWITLAPALLEGAPGRFAGLFHLALAQQVRRLLAFSTRRLTPAARLRVLLALGYATTALQGLDHLRGQTLAALAEELQRQILPDGGHVSRSPAVLLDMVAALIPLRAALTEARLEIPPRLNAALERAVSGLRFFLHGDGGLALFHGTADPAAALAQETLAAADGGNKTLLHAPHSGYARLARGIGVVIADAGAPPDPRLNADGAASTGAFEFSSGQQRIITNCGAPLSGDADWRAAARLTAAHSTACLGNADLGDVERPAWWRLFSAARDMGPRVAAETARDAAGVCLRMQHDGWARRFGHVHRRELFLSADGEQLAGADLFIPADGAGADAPFTARFHLHPDLKTAVARDGASVMLVLPDGSAWRFCAEGAALRVEESVWMAGRARPVRSRQIVLAGRSTPAGAAVSWQLRRLPTRPVTRKRARAGELPELPL